MPFIKPLICSLLCLASIIAFLCLSSKGGGGEASAEQTVLTVWQVDSFEGGKGSRADFLQKVGEDFGKTSGCFVNVVSLSSEAVRLNFAENIFPDAISYGAGMFGIESYIDGYKTWCYGGYCLLSIDTNSDFSDVTKDNTVINTGKDNLSGAAALLCGLNGAVYEKATGAYVKLINGNFKYLLGTQRDIYRLKTRGVSFAVKPLTQFNDLYQNISVIENSQRAGTARKFIDCLMNKMDEVTKLGLMSASSVYDDEMKQMQNIKYEYKLTSPVSEETYIKLKNIIADGDINMLKNLLK